MGRHPQSAQGAAASALQTPLWETQGLQHFAADGTLQERGPVFYYQPFSMTDLNWKHHTPSYSEKPQVLVDFLESIFQTYHPTWVDCQQFLLTLFNTEEHQWQSHDRGLKMAPGQCPRESIRHGEPGLGQHPRGRVLLGPRYQGRKKPVEEVLIGSPQGVKAGAKKPTNVAKTAEVLGKPDESPADFYKRLCEAFRVFIPFDPEAPENQWMITAAFVGQAQSDIKKKKVQKLEGFASKNAPELLEIANRVFVNRDQTARWEAEKKMKQKATLLAAVLSKPAPPVGPPHKARGPNLKRRIPLSHNQCAYCKRKGHWKNECLSHPEKETKAAGSLSRYQPKPPSANLIGLAGVESD